MESYSHALGNADQLLIIAEYYARVGDEEGEADALRQAALWMERANAARAAGSE